MHALAALFLDTYRQINNQKLFWLTLILSGLVVAAFAAVGIDENGLSILWWEVGSFDGALTSDVLPPDQLYKQMFVNFGINVWLAWAATILALVSTAGMIPSFIAGGAVELTLSKPVGRIPLFLMKFAMGLLFTALQVTVFTSACFLVVGVRGGSWEPGIFLAVPLVVVFYSYLFSICALLGLVTRSTIAALLLTLLIWFGLFVVNASDAVVTSFRVGSEMRLEDGEKRLERWERSARQRLEEQWRSENPDGGPVPEPTPERLASRDVRIAETRESLAKTRRNLSRLRFFSDTVYAVKTVLPKTSETVDLLKRTTLEEIRTGGPDEPPEDDDTLMDLSNMSRAEREEMAKRTEAELAGRPVWWVLGTSLAFEAVVLAIACWIFLRRDF